MSSVVTSHAPEEVAIWL